MCSFQGGLLGIQRRAGGLGFVSSGLGLGAGGVQGFGLGVQLCQGGAVVVGQLPQGLGKGQHLVQAAGLHQQGNVAAAVQKLHRAHLAFAAGQAGVVFGLLVRQRLGGLLGGRGALVQGALGLLQGCIYAAQLGGDFGALPLQLVDLALGLALLVLQFFQFLLGFVVGLLGLILFCR